MTGYGQHSRAYITFQARLTPEMKDKLARCAEALGESQTSIVTGALREFFNTMLVHHEVEREENRNRLV